MKKIVLGLVCAMSFSFATNEGTKELVNFLGFTGISVSLDLAVFVTIILTLITWKITKDKERNELKEKEKLESKKEVLNYISNIGTSTIKLKNFRNEYYKLSQNLTNEQKKEFQLNNAHLITEYEKNLVQFCLISPIYNENIYEIVKASMDDFEFARENESIEIIVFSSVKTIYKLLAKYAEKEIANDAIKSAYGLTIEEAEKKLQEFKYHLERK